MPTAERDYTHICPACQEVTVRLIGPQWSCFQCGASGTVRLEQAHPGQRVDVPPLDEPRVQ